MIDTKLEGIKANKKRKAVIVAVNANGTVDIKMNEQIYSNVELRSGLSPILNEIVWVEIPNGNYNTMYVDTAKTVSGGSDETEHSHNNLPILENITMTLINTWNTVTNKVDKVEGKDLSANDFSNTYKTKVDGIQDGAEANINPDWNAISGDARILNKPTIPNKTSDLTNDSNFVSDSSYVHTDNNFSTELKDSYDLSVTKSHEHTN